LPPARPEPSGYLAFAGAALAGSECSLRTATPDDAAFIAAVYASTRIEELSRLDWTQQQRDVFTTWQSSSRRSTTDCTIRTPSAW
jgi:hypothetical protein